MSVKNAFDSNFYELDIHLINLVFFGIISVVGVLAVIVLLEEQIKSIIMKIKEESKGNEGKEESKGNEETSEGGPEKPWWKDYKKIIGVVLIAAGTMLIYYYFTGNTKISEKAADAVGEEMSAQDIIDKIVTRLSSQGGETTIPDIVDMPNVVEKAVKMEVMERWRVPVEEFMKYKKELFMNSTKSITEKIQEFIKAQGEFIRNNKMSYDDYVALSSFDEDIPGGPDLPGGGSNMPPTGGGNNTNLFSGISDNLMEGLEKIWEFTLDKSIMLSLVLSSLIVIMFILKWKRKKEMKNLYKSIKIERSFRFFMWYVNFFVVGYVVSVNCIAINILKNIIFFNKIYKILYKLREE